MTRRDEWGWDEVQDLNPGDFAWLTKWGFNPEINGKLVYIVGAGPGRQRDFWVIGGRTDRYVSLSADFLSPVTAPVYRLSLLDRLAAEVWLDENEITTLRGSLD